MTRRCATWYGALQGLGHQVAVYADGADGMAAIAEDAPDLVITDVFMPGQDGTKGQLLDTVQQVLAR